MVEANETPMIAQNIVLGTWGRGKMMRVKINKVVTRSTKGMKDGVGESATMANPAEMIGKTMAGSFTKHPAIVNPAEMIGKTMAGCLVKVISLKPTICAEFLSMRPLDL